MQISDAKWNCKRKNSGSFKHVQTGVVWCRPLLLIASLLEIHKQESYQVKTFHLAAVKVSQWLGQQQYFAVMKELGQTIFLSVWVSRSIAIGTFTNHTTFHEMLLSQLARRCTPRGECQFPFMHEGKSHKSCIHSRNGVFCETATSRGGFERCDRTCPGEHSLHHLYLLY